MEFARSVYYKFEAVYYKTDKSTYSQGQLVKFTLYNYNPYPIEIDFKPSVLNETGDCVYGCVYIAIYDPITIPSWKSYSWTWDQIGENGQVTVGYYKCELGGYYSNKFKIGDVQNPTNTKTVLVVKRND